MEERFTTEDTESTEKTRRRSKRSIAVGKVIPSALLVFSVRSCSPR
jgi:hypothetical protein